MQFDWVRRFAHVINVEVVTDLLEALRDLLAREGVSQSNRLRCIYTSFKLLKNTRK